MEIAERRAELDDLSAELVERGVGLWSDGKGDEGAALILRSRGNLLDEVNVGEQLDLIRGLFDALEARENALRLLDATTPMVMAYKFSLVLRTSSSLILAVQLLLLLPKC